MKISPLLPLSITEIASVLCINYLTSDKLGNTVATNCAIPKRNKLKINCWGYSEFVRCLDESLDEAFKDLWPDFLGGDYFQCMCLHDFIFGISVRD